MAYNIRCVEYGRARGTVINATFNMRQKPGKGPVAMAGDEQAKPAKLEAGSVMNMEDIGHGKQ